MSPSVSDMYPSHTHHGEPHCLGLSLSKSVLIQGCPETKQPGKKQEWRKSSHVGKLIYRMCIFVGILHTTSLSFCFLKCS